MDVSAVVKRLQDLKLIDRALLTQAFIRFYSRSLPSERFPVCELKLTGVGKKFEADIVSVSVVIDGVVVKTAGVPVVSGEIGAYRITIPQDAAEKYLGKKAECSITVTDKYRRELVSASADVLFGEERKEPWVQAEADFATEAVISSETGAAEVVRGSVVSDFPATVCVSAEIFGNTVWQTNLSLEKDVRSEFAVTLDCSVFGGRSSDEIRLTVSENGKSVFDKAETIHITYPAVPVAPTEQVAVTGDLVLSDYVDIYESSVGEVPIGSLVLLNKGKEADVTVSVVFDGSDLLISKVHMKDEKEIELTIPYCKAVREDTSAHEVTAHVTDVCGTAVVHKVSTLKIRSKYDLNLGELCLRSAQFVNPRNEAVVELVHDATGPLAEAMDGNYSVMGYQHRGKHVVKQLKSVYDMFHNLGMRYVSDTFTFNRSAESYQYVRTPDKVLEDCSGNCLELSILYASIIEAMGLEPVIAFPPGPAIVGAVLHTDLYSSESDYTDSDEVPYVTMKINGKTADVMFIETTVCPWNDDFVDAACLAYNSVDENLSVVSGEGGCVFIKQMRLNGVDPLLSL